ncbi:class I tRNA ligase family protein, partial [Staphylococcus epidermidis]|uniref:class I tRNA ligase family protein n=1 Tax=Staphylococcus epidermidis TaxID=1282 RepID=UPI0011A59859
YITLTPQYQPPQITLFPQIPHKPFIYKPKKPLYWSPSSQSSLAQADIQYHHKRSPSIYLPFHLKESKGKLHSHP